MTENIEYAISAGSPSDLVQYPKDLEFSESVLELLKSRKERGLSIRSVEVTSEFDKWWKKFKKYKEIFFITIAFDFSGKDPLILPEPTMSTQPMTYKVKRNGKISFNLGSGAPLFPPREIVRGLVVYIHVVESDKGIRHVGEVMIKVHEKLSSDGSLFDIVKGFINNPYAQIANIGYEAITKALQPIGTILENNRDDYLGLFQGTFNAEDSWQGKLKERQNGITIELAELP